MLALAAVLAFAGTAAAQEPKVLVSRVEGVITPAVAQQVSDAVAAADAGNHAALMLELDTPGGLDTAMRTIVQALLGADVPVVVYVSPSGARAGSAGAYITLAAHVAAMAPGTNIGAATPVDLQGGDLEAKIVNDATAFIRSIADARGRNADVAAGMVTEGRSLPAQEALDVGVVDVLAGSREALLTEIDGREVTLANGARLELRTAGAATEEIVPTLMRRVLQALANPEIAFLLLSIGGLAILYELATPGGAIAGVLGAIMLVLAFYTLSVLPVTIAGVLLLALAAALFVAEVFAPGIGVFAGGGTIALVFAGLFLFQGPVGLRISPGVLLPIPLLVGAGAVAVGRLAWRARKAPPYEGAAGTLVGAVGTVREPADPLGRVFVGGALWRARSVDGPLAVGQRVRVVDRQGLELLVEPETS
jgi:membrane-bound serine protease (ClpP class)